MTSKLFLFLQWVALVDRDSLKADLIAGLINIAKRHLHQCPRMKIIRIDISLYFGLVNSIQKRIEEMMEKEHVTNMLIVSEGINFIDLAGAEMLVELSDTLKARGGGPLLRQPQKQRLQFHRPRRFNRSHR